MTSRYVSEITTFSLDAGKSSDVGSLFWEDKAVAIILQFWNTLTLYYFLTILVFLFYVTAVMVCGGDNINGLWW